MEIKIFFMSTGFDKDRSEWGQELVSIRMGKIKGLYGQDQGGI